MLALLPRCVAVAPLGTAAAPALRTAQTLAAARHDLCPGRWGTPSHRRFGCVLNGGPVGQISLSGASSALSQASESLRPGQAYPRALARASTGRNRVCPSHSSHSVRVGPAPGPPAWAGTGQSPVPGESESQTRWRSGGAGRRWRLNWSVVWQYARPLLTKVCTAWITDSMDH